MNQRNVEALGRLLMDTAAEARVAGIIAYADWAQLLASRGVLVPSALTDEDAMEVGRAEAQAGFLAKNVVAVLERIAKGEKVPA